VDSLSLAYLSLSLCGSLSVCLSGGGWVNDKEHSVSGQPDVSPHPIHPRHPHTHSDTCTPTTTGRQPAIRRISHPARSSKPTTESAMRYRPPAFAHPPHQTSGTQSVGQSVRRESPLFDFYRFETTSRTALARASSSHARTHSETDT